MGTRTDYHHKCSPHTFGVPVGAPPFFYAGCSACEQKLRDGKVTGLEGPMPKTVGWRRRKKSMTPAKFAAQAKRDHAGRVAAKAVIPWR